jgi:uncharacterized protein (DUF2235 family)
MKRIAICADGTWNEPEQVDDKTKRRKPTNVLKVARTILPRDEHGVDQIVFYHPGVGTDVGLDKFTGGAFGQGMCENVRTLYRFIVYNYVAGDELYFFGFSRGAFTVRTLAGFMKTVGLLQKDDEFYTPELYALYESSASRDTDAWRHAFRHIEDHQPCPPINFIGVWDTVGALGAPGLLGQVFNRNKYKYHDIELHDEILNAYHALAVDERRKPFRPSLWTRPENWTGKLEQAWFPGVHTNVGGGYDPDGVANEPLHWIVEKAEALGLAFDKAVLKRYVPCFNSELRDSMSMMYRAMGPDTRKLGQHAAHGEVIHQATLDRRNLAACNYAPENLDAGLPVVNTTRIERGQPCPPLPDN